MSKVDEWVRYRMDACRYCRGSAHHTCTSFSCSGAVAEAERQYRKERSAYMKKDFQGNGDEKHYGKTVMTALHKVLEVDEDEDIDSIRRLYSLDEILDAVLVHEGILGYSEKLIQIIEDIFRVNLLELDV